jgi:hypothetical protein
MIKTKTMTALAASAVLAMPALCAAQSMAAVAEQDKRMIERQAAGSGRMKLVAAVETRITPGRPYSAEAITESLQVLGDGNRISRKTTTRVYRDNEGRTRREQPGPTGIGETITIWDPVAATSYTLDPATKVAYQGALLAFKTPMPAAASGAGGRGAGVGGRGLVRSPEPPVTGAEAVKVEDARRREKEGAARVEMAETSRDAAGQMKQVLERAASGGGTTTREDLGQQNIEGVLATGSRATTIIPPGGIGNQQEIKIVSEQWFSPELEVLVLTRHSDPRVGETVYRLINIARGQPDPSLFMVPGDYTIRQRGLRTPE